MSFRLSALSISQQMRSALQFPHASDALAYLESGGQVIYADGRDNIANLILKEASSRGVLVAARYSNDGQLEPTGLAALPESVPRLPAALATRGDVLLHLTNSLTSGQLQVCALSSEGARGGNVLAAQG